MQRESNEITRTLANIPAGTSKPRAGDIALLERGQFFACHGRHCIKTYVRPSWMSESEAIAIASGAAAVTDFSRPAPPAETESPMWKERAETLERESTNLRAENMELRKRLEKLETAAAPQPAPRTEAKLSPPAPSPFEGRNHIGIDELYAEVKRRLIADAPALLKVLADGPEIQIGIERKVINGDGQSLKGRVARLILAGFYNEPKTHSATRTEMRRTGPDCNSGNLSRALADFVSDGFMTREAGDLFKAVPSMRKSIHEVDAK